MPPTDDRSSLPDPAAQARRRRDDALLAYLTAPPSLEKRARPTTSGSDGSRN